MQHYDYIFAGTGAAALSLLCALQEAGHHNKKILLIDQDSKRQNDRTWCYWTDAPSPYRHIVHKVWDKISIQTDAHHLHLPIAPYQYQMLRGLDFYNWARKLLADNPQIHWLQANISHLENTTHGATVIADGQTYHAQWVFNSLHTSKHLPNTNHIRWFQHFKGWFIRTQKPVFDSLTATFMDFRMPQAGEVRFMYILPTSSTEALVEFTIFGREVMPQEAYIPHLIAYITQKLGLTSQEYTIEEQEFGVIPMTTQPFPAKTGSFVINIGSAGGCTKASTGFTFHNIQKHTEQLAQSLLNFGHPLHVSPKPARFALYDHVLLHVLDKERMQGSLIFERLFKKHPVQRILRFLADESTLWDDLRIMMSVPSLPFMKAVRDVYVQRASHFLH